MIQEHWAERRHESWLPGDKCSTHDLFGLCKLGLRQNVFVLSQVTGAEAGERILQLELSVA
jgi:hypothetical protein